MNWDFHLALLEFLTTFPLFTVELAVYNSFKITKWSSRTSNYHMISIKLTYFNKKFEYCTIGPLSIHSQLLYATVLKIRGLRPLKFNYAGILGHVANFRDHEGLRTYAKTIHVWPSRGKCRVTLVRI